METSTHRSHLEPGLLRACVGRDELGRFGEELAVAHLVREDGLELLARNWRLREGDLRGELDIVAVSPATGTVVICEVKTRRDAQRFGGALDALAPRQQQRIRGLARAFLRTADLPFWRVRLDLIAIDLGRGATLTHLEGVL